jgi:MFS family permease
VVTTTQPPPEGVAAPEGDPAWPAPAGVDDARDPAGVDAPTAAADPKPPTLLTPRFILVVVVGLLYFLSIGMLVPVLPLFVDRDLRGDDLAVGVAVGAFAVGAVLLRPFAGRIGDRRGRKLLIVGGAFTVAAGTALYFAASALWLLIIARVISGVGEAAFFVGAGTMATDLAPEERRGEAISYWSIAVYGGLAFGPFLGLAVLGDSAYGRAWVVTAGLALVAGLLGLLTRETMEPHDGPPAKQPLLARSALAPGLMLFLGMVSAIGFFAFAALYSKDELGIDNASALFLTYGCLVLAIRILGAKLPDRLGARRQGTLAMGGVIIGMVVAAGVPTVAGLYVGTIFLACGMSMMYPAFVTLALSGVPASERGSSMGTMSSFFDLANGLGSVILGAAAALFGYRGMFLTGACFAVVGLTLLRSGLDPRTRVPVDHTAAALAAGALEGDPI